MSEHAESRMRVVALGIFDGVHLGHQALLRETCRQARARGALACALTFHPHPASLLAPKRAPKLLQSLPARMASLSAFGLDEQHQLAFDHALAEMDYETFIDTILCNQLHVVHVVVGDDFSFGKRRAGTPARFAAAATARGFDVSFLPPIVCADGERISSTRVRAAVAAGDIVLAERLLGRAFELFSAEDLHAQEGNTLLFRRMPERVWPKHGSYISSIGGKECRTLIDGHEARVDGFDNADLGQFFGLKKPLVLRLLTHAR